MFGSRQEGCGWILVPLASPNTCMTEGWSKDRKGVVNFVLSVIFRRVIIVFSYESIYPALNKQILFQYRLKRVGDLVLAILWQRVQIMHNHFLLSASSAINSSLMYFVIRGIACRVPLTVQAHSWNQ